MNILVFVKRVPDTESRIRIQHEARSVAEDGLNFVVSPYDEYGMEEALRLREAKGGTVRVVSVGREETVAVLRKCLAMGADEAFLVRDDTPETYDGLTSCSSGSSRSVRTTDRSRPWSPSSSACRKRRS
jgi:electron transfer flavoprotein beta subunit